MSKAIEYLKQADPKLAEVIDSVAVPKTMQQKEVYPSLLGAVISQQLSTKAAATINRRFLDLFEGDHPAADELLSLSADDLRTAGVSRQKAGYLHNIAEFFAENRVKESDWEQKCDDTIIRELTEIKGVGAWTVQMILMFSLHRPDVFPIDDLIIRKRIVKLHGLEGKGKALKDKLLRIADSWRPYRTTACRYLWRWNDGEK